MPLCLEKKVPTDYENDAALLARIALGSEEPAQVRAAQTQFYERHVRYLYGALSRQRSSVYALAQMSVEDLVQETFRRVFEKAHTYASEPELDSERAERRTRAWMGRIAQRLLLDALEGNREVSATPYVESLCATSEDGPAPSTSPNLRLVRTALASLSEREQDVLTVTALYERAGEAHQRLPNEVAAQLASRWSTSSDNVRAIRSRALKKLRELLTPRPAPALSLKGEPS
jgi:RNA polymerase sigma factor (sigma-70 family)